VSLTETSGRFTTLPDEPTLAATVVALEEHGFSVEVVDDLDASQNSGDSISLTFTGTRLTMITETNSDETMLR